MLRTMCQSGMTDTEKLWTVMNLIGGDDDGSGNGNGSYDNKPNSLDSQISSDERVGKVIWFHHIKSSKKKKHIAEWGKELRLGGYCKPGFPGVLIFEGEGEHVTDFLKRIKRLRWQHLQVRGEDEEQGRSGAQSVDSLRRFPMGIEELPESGMSELAEKCREANLEQLFLTALKISR
ncbi:unnamed protein product [Calypogeia fissa]